MLHGRDSMIDARCREAAVAPVRSVAASSGSFCLRRWARLLSASVAAAPDQIDQRLAHVGLGAGFTGTATQGSVTLTGDSVQTWLHQGAAYVNIHTKANTGGEIRGQLVRQ